MAMWESSGNLTTLQKALAVEGSPSSASHRVEVVNIRQRVARRKAFSPGGDKSLRNLGVIIISILRVSKL